MSHNTLPESVKQKIENEATEWCRINHYGASGWEIYVRGATAEALRSIGLVEGFKNAIINRDKQLEYYKAQLREKQTAEMYKYYAGKIDECNFWLTELKPFLSDYEK